VVWRRDRDRPPKPKESWRYRVRYLLGTRHGLPIIRGRSTDFGADFAPPRYDVRKLSGAPAIGSSPPFELFSRRLVVVSRTRLHRVRSRHVVALCHNVFQPGRSGDPAGASTRPSPPGMPHRPTVALKCCFATKRFRDRQRQSHLQPAVMPTRGDVIRSSRLIGRLIRKQARALLLDRHSMREPSWT